MSFQALPEASEVARLSYWYEMKAFLMPRMEAEVVLMPACSGEGRAGTSPSPLRSREVLQPAAWTLIYLPAETPP